MADHWAHWLSFAERVEAEKHPDLLGELVQQGRELVVPPAWVW
jgi:hypothetical protein